MKNLKEEYINKIMTKFGANREEAEKIYKGVDDLVTRTVREVIKGDYNKEPRGVI